MVATSRDDQQQTRSLVLDGPYTNALILPGAWDLIKGENCKSKNHSNLLIQKCDTDSWQLNHFLRSHPWSSEIPLKSIKGAWRFTQSLPSFRQAISNLKSIVLQYDRLKNSPKPMLFWCHTFGQYLWIRIHLINTRRWTVYEKIVKPNLPKLFKITSPADQRHSRTKPRHAMPKTALIWLVVAIARTTDS